MNGKKTEKPAPTKISDGIAEWEKPVGVVKGTKVENISAPKLTQTKIPDVIKIKTQKGNIITPAAALAKNQHKDKTYENINIACNLKLKGAE